MSYFYVDVRRRLVTQDGGELSIHIYGRMTGEETRAVLMSTVQPAGLLESGPKQVNGVETLEDEEEGIRRRLKREALYNAPRYRGDERPAANGMDSAVILGLFTAILAGLFMLGYLVTRPVPSPPIIREVPQNGVSGLVHWR
jgi:hypothetical protein